MKNKNCVMLAVATTAVLALVDLAQAASPTTITIPDMCCQGCVKKVTAQMVQVPGVGAVQPNLPAKMLTVVPKQDNQQPSPRFLWEAVEKAGQHPSKLEGPFGTFTAKPQS